MPETRITTRSMLLPVMLLVGLLFMLPACRLSSLEGLPLIAPDTVPAGYQPTVTAAAPNVLAISITDSFSPLNLQPNPAAVTAEDWRINGIAPKAVHLHSRAVDELPKQADGTYPVETRHWIYLEMEKPLRNGTYYRITGPYGTITIQFSDTVTHSDSIKVNQVGYHPDSAIRYANLGIFLGSGGTRQLEEPLVYQVLTVADGTIVWSDRAEYRGLDTPTAANRVASGEHVYRLDLSSVPEGGPYIVRVKGLGISHPFEISHAAVRTIAETYVRGLYHQRCGIALESPYTEFTRDSCHTEVLDTRMDWRPSGFITAAPGTPSIAVSGGYHDAGDFDRRPYHTLIPILMLSCFEAFPDHFTDGQYRIPESGNGLPDFLDEALWGLKIWKELQILDEEDSQYGGIRAGTETHGHPEYGKVNAASDRFVYGTWGVTPEVTASGAGMMAQAARLLSGYPAFIGEAEELFGQALLAWDYLRSSGSDGTRSDPSADTPAGTPAGTEADTAEIMYAALQLGLAAAIFVLPEGYAGEEFSERFEELARQLLVEDGAWPHQYRPGNIDARIQTAHFISYLLSDGTKHPALAASLRQIILAQAESGGYMGFKPEGVFYPRGVTRSYGWGAATAQGRYADVYAYAYRLEDDPAKREVYFSMLSQLGDYALGLNPPGVSYVTGLGSVQPQSPLHLDSWFTRFGPDPKGNVPGILIFGPTESRSSASYQRIVSDTLFPSWNELPLERRWADGWSLVNSNEFTVWETMVWNVCLYGVLNRKPE